MRYVVLYLMILSFLFSLILFKCSNSPTQLTEKSLPRPELAPMGDPCNCSVNEASTYDYRVFASNCNEHDKYWLEKFENALRACLAQVNQEQMQDVLGLCRKIRQLCREMDGLLVDMQGCSERYEVMMRYLDSVFSGCNSPFCLTLYQTLTKRAKEDFRRCIGYYFDEWKDHSAMVDSLYQLIPGREALHEKDARDCLEAARDSLDAHGVTCVERLELIVVPG